MNTDLLEHTFTKEGQSVFYRSLWETTKEKLKITVKRDSYDFQSHARIEIFDPKSRVWNLLASIPYPQMYAVQFVDVYSRDVMTKKSAFEVDEQKLLQLAMLIIEPK